MRVIIIVLDSVGIGALPDAHLYGDEDSNTLAHILDRAPVPLPNLERLGLGALLPHPRLSAIDKPAAYALRLATQSPGKDTLTGHWEMMGHPLDQPFVTFPEGFSPEVIEYIEKLSGRAVIGNKAVSGTEIIHELGQEQLATGALIVYTSADSVLQIAAHEEMLPPAELHKLCEDIHDYTVRERIGVARIIARPFVGEFPHFQRTANRRDFAVKPGYTLLNRIEEKGGEVIGVGKIKDIFAGSGVTTSIKTANNTAGIKETWRLIEEGRGRLVFTNLVDFDAVYGHRNDARGYAAALQEFDEALPSLISALKEDDLLIITADHGCDPVTPSTDHSREYVPALFISPSIPEGRLLPDGETLCYVGHTAARWLGIEPLPCGQNVLG